ncbi:putative protein TPRXL [Lytechinus variegatus]|uniref:putative protein TPRXL n=1 Tax=Lytechinus variegatus TaxID=7654 RepID=UPI001BB10947|nr:putative protein TPRXL [Lytechinus variegatus]
MGKHRKEARRAYLKRRRSAMRETKLAGNDLDDTQMSHMKIDSPANEDNSHCIQTKMTEKHTPLFCTPPKSKSSSALLPSSSKSSSALLPSSNMSNSSALLPSSNTSNSSALLPSSSNTLKSSALLPSSSNTSKSSALLASSSNTSKSSALLPSLSNTSTYTQPRYSMQVSIYRVACSSNWQPVGSE